MLIATKITRRILLGLLACTLLITPTVSFASGDNDEPTPSGIVDPSLDTVNGIIDRGSH